MSLALGIKDYLSELEEQGLLRTRKVIPDDKPDGIHFTSNDYLSLSSDPRLATAYAKGYQQYPKASGGSMLLSGYHRTHQAIERAFAEFLQVDECILVPSGYAANLAVCGLFGALGTHCLIDKGVHASIYDGLKLSRVEFTRFLHNDVHDLGKKITSLTSKQSNNLAIITEGIFSMTGQFGPLAEIASNAIDFIVDEAHSFGVLGDEGRGAVSYHGLSQNTVPLRIIPLGKAFSAHGAILAGRHEFIAGILQAGRSLIYTTAVSPAFAYGLLKNLEAVIEAESRRLWLFTLIKIFKEQIKQSPLEWTNSDSPIQQLKLGSPHLANYYAKKLESFGLYCSSIRPPTTNLTSSGLRIVLNYHHREEQILQLFKALHQIYESTSH